MAVNFSQGTQISALGTSLVNIPGRIVQVVPYQTTVNTTVTTAAWVDVMTNSITVNKAGNKILVEYMLNDRSDQGNGNWCLIYHRILCNGVQVMYSGYNGAAANHIGFYQRNFIYTPATTGTYTFVASVLSYSGTAWIGTYNNGSFNHQLNLYEIGS